jgi:hypothetical protein
MTAVSGAVIAVSGIDAHNSSRVVRAPRKSAFEASSISGSANTAIAAEARHAVITLALKNARVDDSTTPGRPSACTRVTSGWKASTGMAMKRLARRTMREAT